MPASVFHALTATTPDDPAYEIRPSHYNSAHLVTLAISATEISQLFSNSPTVSFGMSGTAITASANVTAAPSPVNVTGENGSSVNAQTIAFLNGNGVTLGVSTAANGASITGSHNGLTTAALSNHSHGVTANNGGFNFQTLSFSNANGVSFGTSAGSAITASHNAITTARASNDAIGLNTAQSNVTWTVNSSGISLDARGYAGTATAITGNASVTLNSAGLSFNGSNLAGVGTTFNGANLSGSMTVNSAGVQLSMSAGNYLTTAAVSNHSHGVTAANGGFNWQTLSFSNANGISFGTSAGSAITASHNAITTARASTDAIGLNTAGTNVTWTVNSSGISFNAAGYAGTGTTFNGANISGSMTQNSVGLQLSLSVAAPGAAAENNAIQLLGANTSGNTTASGSTIGWSGINLTLSGTNASQVVVSAPATSSLVGTSGLSISTNGSTISAFPIARSEWNNLGGLALAATAQGNSLVSIQPFMLEWPLVCSNVIFPLSVNVATTTNNSSAYVDVSASGVVYTRNGSSLSSLFSFSQTLTQSFSSNATGTVTGAKAITATFAGQTMTPGNYWIAFHVSTNNTATGGANTTALANTISMVLGSNISTNVQPFGLWGNQTNNSVGLYSGLGLASTGATRASYDLSAITVTGTRALLAPVAFGLRNATYQ